MGPDQGGAEEEGEKWWEKVDSGSHLKNDQVSV